MEYANGDKYIGEWINNNRHGDGTIEYSNGNKRSGKWRLNEIDE